MSKLREVLKGIKPVDESRGPAIQARLDNLTKPLGSLVSDRRKRGNLALR